MAMKEGIHDFYFEGAWDLTTANGVDFYSPLGEGLNSVVVTMSSGKTTTVVMSPSGIVVDSGARISAMAAATWVSDDSRAAIDWCDAPQSQTHYPSYVSATKSGDCWVFKTTPAGCTLGECKKSTGTSCGLSVVTVVGTDPYQSDCQGPLKFKDCNGVLDVCH
jgi:hypothetical protein